MLKEIDIVDRGKLSIEQLFEDKLIFENDFYNGIKNSNYDGELVINSEKFYFEVITQPSVSKLNRHVLNKHIGKGEYIVIFDAVTEEVSEYCRENKINYLDSAGNAYVNTKNLVVYIEGRQSNKYKEFTRRIFQKTGLKLIYEILRNPELLNEPYRKVSEYVGISTASVGNLVEELEVNGFLIDIGGRKRINNVEKLILKWVFSYAEVLKPKLHRGYFKLIKRNSLEKMLEFSREDKIYFGGEYGAFITTENRYIKPSNLIIYTDARLSLLAKKYHIVPINKPSYADETVEIIEPFWNTNVVNDGQSDIYNVNISPLVTDTLLIYADLLDSKNSRNIEVAEKIYKNEIRDRFLKSIV